jgi:hypothetical protein
MSPSPVPIEAYLAGLLKVRRLTESAVLRPLTTRAQLPVPQPNLLSVVFPIGHGKIVFERPRSVSMTAQVAEPRGAHPAPILACSSVGIPVKDVPLAPLFRYLSCQNVVLLLELLLCEQKARGRTAARTADTNSPPSGQILLLSNSLAALTPAGEALRSLVFPLLWPVRRRVASAATAPAPEDCSRMATRSTRSFP